MISNHVAQGNITKYVSLPYAISVPSKGHRWPLIINLHPAGCNGDNPDFRAYEINRFRKDYSCNDFAIAIPQCPQDTTWSPDAIAKMVECIHAECAWKIDCSRIYLTGFSMGGRGVWDTAMEYPNLFAAVVPISGYSCYLKASRMKNLPSFAFHGVQDDIVPVDETFKMYRELRHYGKHHQICLLENAYHNIQDFPFTKGKVFEWLKQWNTSSFKRNCIEQKSLI